MPRSDPRAGGPSIASALRRSQRAVYVLIAAALVVWAVATIAVASVFHPRWTHLDTAVGGLRDARAAVQDERSALLDYMIEPGPATLAAYTKAQADLATADAAVLRAGLGGRDILARLVSVQSAEQAWTTGWAAQVVPAVQQGLPGATPQFAKFLAQGRDLFSSYAQASARAISDLSARTGDAADAEQTATLAGFFSGLVLLVLAGGVATYGRRRSVATMTRPVRALMETVRRIEAREAADVDAADGPAELAELGHLVIGMARELDSLRGVVDLSAFQAEERARKLMQVLELTRAIGGNLSLRPVMDAVTRASLEVSGADRAVLWTADDDGIHASADTGGPPDESIEPSEPVVQAATYGRTSHSAPSHDGSGTPRLAVPMTFGGRVVGVVELRGEAVLSIEPGDVELIETLASNGASAVAAARAHGVTESLSMTDALTRLPNRRQLEHDLATECERARRYRRSSALIMLDVDGFKAFNDRYGHQAGDQVLSQFGQLLADSIRASDSAYRYGGEEFAVLVREASVGAAADLAERLRQQVADRFAVLPRDVPVTASFGVVGVDQVDPEPSSLIRAADEALYAAKERGRNRVVSFR